MENIVGLAFDFLNETMMNTTMMSTTKEDATTSVLELEESSTLMSMFPTTQSTRSTTTQTTKTTTTTMRTTTAKPCLPWSTPRCDPLIIANYLFSRYGNTLAYCIGIPGSFFTIVILIRMRPFNSSSLWLLVLSCFDFFALTMRLITNQIGVYQVMPWVDWSCRFFYVMAEFTQYATYWFLVGLTVERLIAVWFPLKMNIWCTVRRAAIAISVIIVLCLASTMHIPATRRVNGYNACVVRLKYVPMWNDIWLNIVINTIMYLIPVVSLIVLNILISCRLKHARKVQKQMSDHSSKDKDKQQRQINRMLLAATIWAIICIAPTVVSRYIDRSLGPTVPRTPDLDRYRQIMENTSAVLRMYNHAANFVLYVIAARKFRSEVIRLITCNKFVGFGKRAPSVTKRYITDTKVTSDGSSATHTTG